jgi:hypothetical protein
MALTEEEKAARRMHADLVRVYHFSQRRDTYHSGMSRYFKTLCGDIVPVEWSVLYATPTSRLRADDLCLDCERLARGERDPTVYRKEAV